MPFHLDQSWRSKQACQFLEKPTNYPWNSFMDSYLEICYAESASPLMFPHISFSQFVPPSSLTVSRIRKTHPVKTKPFHKTNTWAVTSRPNVPHYTDYFWETINICHSVKGKNPASIPFSIFKRGKMDNAVPDTKLFIYIHESNVGQAIELLNPTAAYEYLQEFP